MALVSRMHTSRSAASIVRPRRNPRWTALLALPLLFLVAMHVTVQHQGARQASVLAGGEWLFTLMLALIILAYAYALGQRLARPLLALDQNPLGEALATLALGYGICSQGLLIAGLLRLYYAPLFLLIFLLLTYWLREELSALARRLRRASSAAVKAGLSAIPTLGQRLILITLLITLLPVAMRDTIPVTGDVPDWDGVAYHLSAPRIYVAAHRIVPVPTISLANAPSGADIFAVLGFFAGTDTLLKVLNLLLGLLFGAATYAFGRRHFGGSTALFSVILLFTPLWVIELLPATVPDFTTAFFLVLGASDAFTWLAHQRAVAPRSRADAGQRHTRTKLPFAMHDRLLVRAGLLIGFSVSCKLTSAPVIPALCLTVGLTCLLRPGQALVQRLIQALHSGILLGVGALLPLALWLLKSAYFFGNPLYPQGVTATTVDCSQALNCTTLPAAHTAHLWWMATTFARVMWQYVSPLSVVLLLAPFLLRRAPQRAALLFVLLGGAIWLEFVPLFNPPRYWLGLIAISVVLIAGTCGEILSRLPWRPALAELPLIAYLGIQSIFALSIAVGLAQRSGALTLATGSISRYDYLAQRVRPYQAFAYANDHLPAGAVIATVHTTLGYYLDRPYLNDWYGEQSGQLQGDRVAQHAVMAMWCGSGVRYAIFNRGANEYNVDSLAGIRPLASFRWIHEPGLQPTVLFSARGVDLLALNPCAVAPPARQ